MMVPWQVITGSWDKTLKCWNPRGASAQERYALSSMEGRVAMEFFELTKAGQSKSVIGNLKLEETLFVNAIAFNPVWGTFATCGCDGFVEHMGWKQQEEVVSDSEETLQLAQESRDKMKQINKEIKPANYTKINHRSGVFVPPKALSLEELYFSNISKTANVSKSFLIPNENVLDNTTPSVARKFLNEVKSTILTLQRVVKQRMIIKTHNWASSDHQEFHKIVREEIFPIVNQVDARVQNLEIQFLKEAAKFVGDFKSLTKEADDSLAKHKAMELDNELVSQDIISVVQNASVVDTSDFQTELERMKECFENCIIKKENEYAKHWNDWYKKCNECKYDKISYDKAYKDMQQKIERLQA
nr:hypothetical protein [Tanacetum cinerariifolium]